MLRSVHVESYHVVESIRKRGIPRQFEGAEAVWHKPMLAPDHPHRRPCQAHLRCHGPKRPVRCLPERRRMCQLPHFTVPARRHRRLARRPCSVAKQPFNSLLGIRSYQRQMVGFETPTRCMISQVPCPSALPRLICAHQTCFCFAFPSWTTAARRRRSSALTWINPLGTMKKSLHQPMQGTAPAAFNFILQYLIGNGKSLFHTKHYCFSSVIR